jgi:hypothetical protein
MLCLDLTSPQERNILSLTQDQARNKIHKLVEKYRVMTQDEKKGITEAGVAHQFLDPLFEALGWPVQDPARYKYELSTRAGRPDMTLIPEQGGTIFVEAKRFGAIKELEQVRKTIAGIVKPGQMSLPGMATDRTQEEQQAINYAFESRGTWAILTNFEKLRLFNARRDWLVLSFERPSAYLDEFDLLWQLSYESVCSGGLDLLSDQRHREDVDTDYLHFINEWREKLAQDIVAHHNDNAWAFAADGRVNLADLRAVVQRVLDRLVVVRFAEDHLVTRPGMLYGLYELSQRNPYISLGELVARFYQGFDPDHNSALFAFDRADEAVLSDEVLGGLVQKLYEARYRAMPADIMGNTYEQYLGKRLVQVNGNIKTADNLETRKKQGSYYTPQVIVRYVVDNALGRYLYGTTDGRPDGEPLASEHPKTAADVRGLRVLDPACGSGSFLIYAYQVLADFYRREIRRLEAERDQREQELIQQGLITPFDLRLELTPWTVEIERLQDYPRLILETHLYGVDLDPQAAEIATVNLIMRAMADRRRNKRRLPLILNQNVKVGNSLIGAGPADSRYADHAADLAELRRLRLELAAETNGSDHRDIQEAIDEIAGGANAALNQGLVERFQDVEAHRPFNWAVEFPEVFLDDAGQGRGEAAGFEVVIGNPPWEIVKPDLREFYAQFDPRIESQLTRRQTEARIAELNAEDPARETDWRAQKTRIEQAAAFFRQGAGYTRQGRGDTATHKLFLERGYSLLEREGRLGFVVPSGIYSDLGARPLREMLLNEGHIQYLFSFSNERNFFPDVHHAARFTLMGAQRGAQSDGFWAAFRFNPRVAIAPDELPAFLANPTHLIYLHCDSLPRSSPRSLSVLEFQTQQDVTITEKVYGDWPLVGDELEGERGLYLNNEFHMTSSRALFAQELVGWPLYEGRMIDQFDHRRACWVSGRGRSAIWRYSSAPERFSSNYPWRAQYYIDPQVALGRQVQLYRNPKWRMGVCMVTAPTNRRTVIASMLPMECGVGNSITTIVVQDAPAILLYALSILNSYSVDYVMRFRVKLNLNFFIISEIPLPRLNPGNLYFDAIVPRAARLTCTTPDFAGLWQEVMGQAWDASKGATAPATRQALRDELDALVAHLYGLSRDDFAHVLGTFPLVFPANDAGRARKRAQLAAYDELAKEVKDWKRA